MININYLRRKVPVFHDSGNFTHNEALKPPNMKYSKTSIFGQYTFY